MNISHPDRFRLAPSPRERGEAWGEGPRESNARKNA
jgi:hypothetical protein